MPIKFNCPHCKKAFSVKDELAGKRAACPVCKKVLVIPAPRTAAVDVETLAASAFADGPAAQAAKPAAATIDFTCPHCDEAIQMSADLGGKQAPCPECRRIIKVPLPEKKDPTNWRRAEPKGPTGARRDPEPVLDGAWGTASKGTVSREVLEEAGALPTEREPRTLAQKIRLGIYAVGGVALLIVGWLVLSNYLSRSLQEKAVARALAYADGKEKVKPTPEVSAATFRAVGEFYLGKNDLDNAVKHFRKARSTLQGGSSSERDALLLDLALSQVELGGSAQEVDDYTRLSWEKAATEWRQTLQMIEPAEAKSVAAREVCRKLIVRGQPQVAATVIVWLNGALSTPVNPNAPPAEGAKQPTQPGGRKPPQKEPPKAAANNEPGTSFLAQAVALYWALSQTAQADRVVPAPADKTKADLATRLIHTSAWREQKKLDAARRFLVDAKKDAVPERVHCLLSVAAAALDQNNTEEATACMKDALNLVEPKDKKDNPLKGEKNPSWLFLGWARLAIQANLSSQAAAFTAAIKKEGLKSQAALETYRAQVKEGKDLGDDSWSKAVPDKTSLAYGQALEVFVRAKAREGSGSDLVEKIDSLEPEKIRPLGYAGVALGVQDKGR